MWVSVVFSARWLQPIKIFLLEMYILLGRCTKIKVKFGERITQETQTNSHG